jgi:two-component system, NtrC family, nitrogen regulation sensor histidine kinase NtrY
VVALAMALALATFVIFAGFTPIPPTNRVVLTLFAADGLIISILLVLVAHQAWKLRAARRARQAGARLHLRIVGLFSIIAAVPALIMAFVASTMLERGLNPAFMQDLRGFVGNTADAARLYRDSQCKGLLREADLTASLLSSGGGKALYDYDKRQFRAYFTSNVKALGFTTAALIKRSGETIEKPDLESQGVIARPEASDFADADKGDPVCLITDDNVSFVALRPLRGFTDTYLYAARPVDPFANQFTRDAEGMIALYTGFDAHRRNIEIAFAIMFVLLAAIMLLSAVWLGIGFANGLVSPLRRLIRATDQVASGNLYVQVPINRKEGDLAHLGETFNKMTSELRYKENNLMAASALIDERRLFTEAVLSGVPAEVIGVDAQGNVNVLNPSARKLLETGAASGAGSTVIGKKITEIVPELMPILAEAQMRARHVHGLVSQGQLTLSRAGRERIFHVRVTS